ncbi:SGNH/GDSL hydrolase family protein [Azorhizobium doebereinerae]|uniref:SGNH/GDSL hydrolase family protein n=1 Tax=Azorhizobium doebereinerae TaxID=281091 RepID=UPI00040EC3C1|nr:SGNH/GDSL hydrolase family protein [Azorhizobium doebereinerae]
MTTPRLLHFCRFGLLALPLVLPLPAFAASDTPVCSTVTSQPPIRLPKAADKLAKTGSLTIVALGSSSTAGVGASSPSRTYPARLEAELSARFPGATITVVNRGVNGEDAPENVRRMERDVASTRPDVVLWQVGTNALLRQFGVTGSDGPMRAGIAQIRSFGAEPVLIDPQYAPWVVVDPDAKPMVKLIADLGREQNVPVFNRFAMMQTWHERDKISFPQMSFIDGLHGNDFAYDCLARSLAYSLAMGLKPSTAQPAVASSGAPPAR